MLCAAFGVTDSVSSHKNTHFGLDISPQTVTTNSFFIIYHSVVIMIHTHWTKTLLTNDKLSF